MDGGRALFLLIRDSYKNWGFPKGHLEADEPPELAALREVQEKLAGAREARAFMARVDFAPSDVAFDAAFAKLPRLGFASEPTSGNSGAFGDPEERP